jgi:SAM-dependent methyltransferase
MGEHGKGTRKKGRWTVNEARYRSYGLGFGFDDYRVAYVPALGESWDKHYAEYTPGQVEVRRGRAMTLQPGLSSARVPGVAFTDTPRCGLADYESTSRRLHVTLAETTYGAYLNSAEKLDEPSPTGATFREDFLVELTERQRSPRGLTNICGVGLFVITADEHIIATRHSANSHVYPGRTTFSASGSMAWGVCPNPFTAMLVKANEELNHQCDAKRTKLVTFGADARKLYFQFAFVEHVRAGFDEIERIFKAERVRPAAAPPRLDPIRFRLPELCERLVKDCWEPAAEAALLAIAAKKWTRERVTNELRKRRQEWWKRALRDEWDFRASRRLRSPDSSVRYSLGDAERIEKSYAAAVVEFVGKTDGMTFVEVGAGTGRISEMLLQRGAAALICIEPIPAMVARHKERTQADPRVTYIEEFAQDVTFAPRGHCDVALCSRVLIHNVGDDAFEGLVDALCKLAARVFVFEDVGQERSPSPATELRPQSAIEEAFKRRGLIVDAFARYSLGGDEYAFIKFLRPGAPA